MTHDGAKHVTADCAIANQAQRHARKIEIEYREGAEATKASGEWGDGERVQYTW